MWSRRQKSPPQTWFRGPVLFLLLSCTARNIFPLELLEPVQIPDESLLLKTKKCSLHFFNRWLLSPSQHSFPAHALLNYSIPVSERATVPLVGRGSSVKGGTLPAPRSCVCSSRINPPTHTLLLQIKTAFSLFPLLPAGSKSLQHVMVKVSTSEIPDWAFTHSLLCLCWYFSAHQVWL